MSLSIPNKPNNFDLFIFPVVTPTSNLHSKYNNGKRLLLIIFIYAFTVSLCLAPCCMYINYKSVFTDLSKLGYVKTGAICCLIYILCLTWLSFRSEFVDKNGPKVLYILIVVSLLFLIMAILLCTHKTYDLSIQTENVNEILTVFQGIVGITKEDNKTTYNTNATTIDQIQKNLDYLQDQLKNNNNVQDDINSNLKQINNLVDTVKKSLQEQIESLNKELDNDPDEDEKEEINKQISTLKTNIEELNTYYDQLPNYLNKNKGRIFIRIMCILFLIIYSTVSSIDIAMFLFDRFS